MNLEEIKNSVENKIPVYWASMSYQIIKNKNDDFYIKCSATGHLRGLTYIDGETLAEPESDFFKNDEN